MKTKNMNNIHVFRVNRVSAKVKETSNQAAVDKANSRTRLTAETKRSICEDHMENPKITQEVLALKYGCKRTTVAKVSITYTFSIIAKLTINLDYKVQRSLAFH